MKFLNKDINRRLLALIIVLLVLFIIFTVYYETTLSYILRTKKQNDERFSEITSQIILEKLNETDRLKEIAVIDKFILEEKYNDLGVENKNLKNKITALQEELTLVKSELDYQKVKVEGPIAQFRLIQNKNQLIQQLNEKISVLCSKIKYYNSSDKECG